MNAVVIKDLPIFYFSDLQRNPHIEQILPESEAGHASRVLRLSEGEEIYITDGLGSLCLAKLTAVSKRSVSFAILEQIDWPKNWRGRLTLAIAPTKAIERMEWLCEKAVEIGVDRIILLRTKHSERKRINEERLNRIMLSAMKQSQKAILPSLNSEVSLEVALRLTEGDNRLIAHCREGIEELKERFTINNVYAPGSDTTIFIGPEGDFTIDEIKLAQECGVHPITLGESRLRTETAAIVGLQWLHTLLLMNP